MNFTKPRPGYKIVKSLFGKYEEMPEDWDVKQVIELGELVTGSTPSTFITEYYGDEFLWATPPDLKPIKYITTTQKKLSKKGFEQIRKIPPNSVLVTCIGTVGITGLSIKEMGTNQQINSIICNKDNPEFVYYQLSLNQEKLKNIANQAVIPILNKTDFGTVKIILPKNKEEQRKIASILSNVDSLINQTQKEIEQTQRLKKGLMQKLLTKGIGHTKFKKVKWLFEKEIEIPESWNIQKGKDVCKEIIVGIVIKPASLYADNGVPCLRSFNIKEDRINEKNIVLISEQANEDNSKSKLNAGDVLIVRTGYPGTACVVPQKFVGGNCVDLIIARPKQNLDSYFLSKFLNSTKAKNQILRMQGGLAQQHFNVGEMKNLLVIIPPLREQQEIVAILSNVDFQIKNRQECKSQFENLKKGLMQKLLTGQIRAKV